MQANKQQICSIFGWTSREFDSNITLGMPAKKKGGARTEVWTVDTVAVSRWLVNRELVRHGVGDGPEASPGTDAERARLLRSQANISELQESKLRETLIPAEEVVEGWEWAISRARSLLLGLPPAVADQIVTLVRGRSTDEAAIRAVRELLADRVHDALSELA